MRYYVVESPIGNRFTTFTDRNGDEQRVPMGANRIGPFHSIDGALAYLSAHSIPLLSYEIESVEATE